MIASQCIQGDYSDKKVIRGHISTTDTDFYKVWLPANDETVLSINSSAYPEFEVIDENNTIIVGNFRHDDDPTFIGAEPYVFKLTSSRYYYIRVSDKVMSGNYLFTIGTPNYTVDHYDFNSPNPLTLASIISSYEDTFNLSNIDEIPNRAIVYKIEFDGQKNKSCIQ